MALHGHLLSLPEKRCVVRTDIDVDVDCARVLVRFLLLFLFLLFLWLRLIYRLLARLNVKSLSVELHYLLVDLIAEIPASGKLGKFWLQALEELTEQRLLRNSKGFLYNVVSILIHQIRVVGLCLEDFKYHLLFELGSYDFETLLNHVAGKLLERKIKDAAKKLLPNFLANLGAFLHIEHILDYIVGIGVPYETLGVSGNSHHQFKLFCSFGSINALLHEAATVLVARDLLALACETAEDKLFFLPGL